jgi:hypothetical protein
MRDLNVNAAGCIVAARRQQPADAPRRAGAPADHPGDDERDLRGDGQTHPHDTDWQTGFQLGMM